MHPTPKWRDGKWQVDLRTPWNLGRHFVDAAPPPHGLVDAIHAAYALLARLEAARPPQTQLSLLGARERTFAALVDEYLARRRYRSNGGKRGVEEYARAVKRDLGHLPLSAFLPPKGTDLLFATVEAWRKTIAAGTANNRLCLIRCALRWGTEPGRRYLDALPTFPSPKVEPDELLSRRLDKWVDEATFRAGRERIYEHQTARNMLAADLRRQGFAGTAAEVHDLICRRRLFLSFAFYTGMRRFDLFCLVDRSVSPDFECFCRTGHKTGIDESAEDIPDPLLADLEFERQRLGRPYRKGEAIAGGPWKNVCRVLATACDLAGVERFNLRDCRRSFVYHKALGGLSEEDCIRLMGHRDSRMIRSVYLQLLPRLRRNHAGKTWPKTHAVPGTGAARIYTFPQKDSDR